MAIRGELIGGEVIFPVSGTGTRMVAKIDLIDDVLGRLGAKQITVEDEMTVAQVRGFVEAMLPGMAQQLGIAITLPAAPHAPEGEGQ